MRCEMCGTDTEVDYGELLGAPKANGRLCKPCADGYFEGEAMRVKNREALDAERKAEREQLREQQEARDEKRGVRQAKKVSLRDTGIMTDVKPPKDVRGLKFMLGPMRAEFKSGSFRQRALDQALEDSTKLDDRLHHDARWLLQRGYLKLVGGTANEVTLPEPVINKEDATPEGPEDASQAPSLAALARSIEDTPQEEKS